EPLSNLDARLRLQTREEIKRIQRETGITTIFVTHDQEEAMSISDEIVIMNYGVEQQVDEPQKVYLNPANLFVARFLGNPPINVIQGEIKDNQLMIQDRVFGVKKAPAGKYNVGLRPENFKVSKEGFEVEITSVDTIGRDTLIHFNLGETSVRALVDSETYDGSNKVKLSVKEEKIHLFNMETGTVVS